MDTDIYVLDIFNTEQNNSIMLQIYSLLDLGIKYKLYIF